MAALAVLAAPPGRDRGQFQGLSEEMFRDARQEGVQGGVFQQADAEGIGDGNPTAPGRFHQARDPQARIRLQFQRVAIVIIDATQNDIHRLQAPQGAQPHPSIAHGQITPLHQTVAEVVGEVGVFEVGFVERPGREDDHAGIVGVGRRVGGETGAHILKEQSQAVYMGVAEQAGEDLGHHRAVLQRIAGTGRRLSAVAEHPHLTVGAACQIRGIEDQRVRFLTGQRMAGTQETRVAINQCRRQQSAADQFARAIDVAQQQVEDFGALGKTGLYASPFLAGDQQRDGIQNPGALAARRIAVYVVGDAVVAQQTPGLVAPLSEFVLPQFGQDPRQVLPMGAHRTVRCTHLIVCLCGGPILRDQRFLKLRCHHSLASIESES